MARGAQSALDAACLLLLPIMLVACALLQVQASALLTLAAAIAALALLFAGWERSSPGLRQILPAAVMASAAVVGRIVFAAMPNVQPVTAICIISGAAFGKRTGFMTGAMGGLVSSFFLGLGAWTPWQMYAWGLVGYVAGIVFCGRSQQGEDAAKMSVLPVLAYGFIASFAFGAIMNTWTLVGFAGPVSWGSAAMVYGAGLAFDGAHAISTVAFLGLLYIPLKGKLHRMAMRYELAGS